MSRVEQAVSCFQDGFNCSQSILSTFSVEYGLNRDIALKLATGIGGGTGLLGKTCGAVTGALMVIGLKYGKDSIEDDAAAEKTFSLVQEFIKEFTEINGSSTCDDLLDCDISTPEGLNTAKEKNLFTTLCPNFVRTSAEILEKIL
ncbi:MAG: C-GCAxxG-C-C family protein [Candidatus Thorarchaeota archaeon]